MTDRAHNRNRRIENSARHDLLVELPKILDAAPATRDHDEIHRAQSPGRASSLSAVAISAAAPMP